MRFYFLAFCSLLFLSSFSQPGSGWQWASYSGVAANYSGHLIKDVRLDGSSNTYAVGSFWGTMNVGGTSLATLGDGSSAGNFDQDAFVVKYDAAGTVLWAKQFGVARISSNENGSVIAVDASGNVYIGGSGYNSGATLGTGFVVKYDAAGNLQWSKTFTYYDIGGINIGPDGNLIVMESDQTHKNIFKLDASTGNVMWQAAIANAGSNGGSTYHDFIDGSGNSYCTFFTTSATTVTVNGTPYATTGLASFVLSLDYNGATRWVDQINNAQIQIGFNVDKTNGDSYVQLSGGGGSTFQGVNIGAGATQNSYFILNNAGALTSYALKSPYRSGLLVITASHVYSYHILAGYAGGTATEVYGNYFIANRNTAGADLGVVAKYDKGTANPVWMNSFEINGNGVTALSAIDVSASGDCVVGGRFGMSAKFGTFALNATPATANNPADWYVAKFNGASVGPQPSTTWTGTANNGSWADATNWTNGVPTGSVIANLPAGLPNYPQNITTANSAGRLQIDNGVTITLPLNFTAGAGIVNNGAIRITESGTFYGGFNSGQTLITGTGKVVIASNAVQPFWYVPLNNSVEFNCTGTVSGFSNGAPINGSLIFTNGLYNNSFGTVVMGDPNATVTYSNTSYLIGTLQRAVNASGTYTFPIGTASNLEAATVSLTNVAGPQNITASFSTSAPGTVNTTAGGVPVTAALNGGFWTLTPNAALTSGKYKITLNERGASNTVTDATRYVVIKRPNSSGSWAFYGNNGVASQTGGTSTAVASAITGFSDFAIGIASGSVNAVLPVRWAEFTVSRKDAGALLQWKTTNETAVDRYEAEWSSDGRTWSRIGERVAANTPAADYQFLQAALSAPENFYRIKEVDKDGRVSYSNTQKLNADNKVALTLYPNPVQGASITINLNAAPAMPLRYTIINASASVVAQGALSSAQTTLFVGELPAGVYTVRLSNGASATFAKQ